MIFDSVCVREHTVPHNFDVEKIWNESTLRNFNDKLERQHRISDADKFIYLRRMLKGSAAIFAQSSRAFTLEQLKEELTSTLSVPPVFRQLRSRRLSSKETALRYVMDMQRIASRAPIPEPELINSPAHTAGIRFLANNVDDLKSLLKKFETFRPRKGVRPTTAPPSAPVKIPTPTSRAVTSNTNRCYNCSEYGHHRGA